MRRIGRRHFLAAAAVAPVAACTPDQPAPQPEPTPSEIPSPTAPAPSPSPSPTVTVTEGDSLGLELPSSVEAVIFDGAFGLGYVTEAANIARREHDGLRVAVRSSNNIIADVAGRFEEGETPPDLIDNSGPDQIAVAEIVGDLLALDDLMAARNLEGLTISETLHSGVIRAGTFQARHVVLNYALSVYGLWHSASSFAALGWSVPAAWDEMVLLGEEALENDQYLFSWAPDAAAYYAELAIASAIKEGGHEVRRALDNLQPDGWHHPAVEGVLEALATCVDEGHLLRRESFMEAQAEWSLEGSALFYPSGSWIAREMEGRTDEGFEMTVAPVPTLTAAPTFPPAAAHAQPIEQFIVPRDAENPAGGLELLRVMLSREVAEEFARVNQVPTVVRSTVPADMQSTALAAQTRMLADAGEYVFDWRFINHYGLTADYNRLWTQFLSGWIGPSALADELQALSDGVRTDRTVHKYVVD